MPFCALPAIVYVTVSGVADATLRVNRNTPGSSPASAAVESNAVTLTSGVGVSPIVTVADAGEPTSYGAVTPSVRITVSGPSVTASLVGFTSTVVVATPAAKFAVSGRPE